VVELGDECGERVDPGADLRDLRGVERVERLGEHRAAPAARGVGACLRGRAQAEPADAPVVRVRRADDEPERDEPGDDRRDRVGGQPQVAGDLGDRAPRVPADQQDQLSEQECTSSQPGSLCVPNEILANGPFPACTANSVILGNYTGVCLSDCLDFGIQGVALAKGSCSSGFTCAPCEQFGQPTGAPGCPP